MEDENIHNLVDLIAGHIGAAVSIAGKDKFLNNPIIKAVRTEHPGLQRMNINRYLLRELLKFKASNPDVNVVKTVVFLSNDGFNTDWVKVFKMLVMPFMIKHQIFGAKLALGSK